MRNFLSATILVASCAHTLQKAEVKKPELVCPSRSRLIEGTESPSFMDALTGEVGKRITACLDKAWPSFAALEEECKRDGGKVTVFDWANRNEPPGWGCALIELVPRQEEPENTEK